MVATTPTAQQERPLSPVVSARTGDYLPPQNRPQPHEEPSLPQITHWRDSSVPLQCCMPDNRTSAAGLHLAHRSPFQVLERDHPPCNQTLWWPGGPAAHGGIRGEEGRVSLAHAKKKIRKLGCFWCVFLFCLHFNSIENTF